MELALNQLFLAQEETKKRSSDRNMDNIKESKVDTSWDPVRDMDVVLRNIRDLNTLVSENQHEVRISCIESTLLAFTITSFDKGCLSERSLWPDDWSPFPCLRLTQRGVLRGRVQTGESRQVQALHGTVGNGICQRPQV